MKYLGKFKDINDKLYRLEIITGNDTGRTIEVTLSDEPFVTSVEGGEEHLYKAAKYSSATIGMISTDYMFDLYSSTAQQNKVTLYDDLNSIVWTGYLTSNLYNVGYEKPEEVIELEAIDALSTLQYYNYETLGTDKEIVSFIDIINRLISRCNSYTSFYISDNIQYSSSRNECLSSKLYISEQNFFDEDNEPLTCQEVLEEICKYLGVTCVAYGNSVYFLDYDAINKGINSYYKFNLNSPTPTKVTLSKNKAIDGSDYVENGGQLSLDNVYNKVTVTDSLYSFDSIIPSIWDDDYLTNYNGSGYIQEINEDGKGGKHKCFFKYYKHKNYKSYYYDKATLREVSEPSKVNYSYTQNYVGATICKHFSEKVTDYNTKYNDINFTDYVLLHCHNTTNVDDTVKRKMFSLIVNDANTSFLGGNTYLIIKGDFRYLDRESEMYIMQGYMNKDDNFNPDRLFIWARLQYGSQYWNGTSWTATPSDFKLYYDSNGQTDHCINQVFPVKNNITWNMGLEGEEGYAIPMPSRTEVITGKPTFTLYQPYKLDGSYRCDAVWLSNFDIVAKVQNFNTDVDKDSDTEYTNVINEDFVNDLGKEEFKICTWDSKEANFSAVAYKDNGKYSFLDRVYNKANSQYIRPEEHYIYRLVNQYSTPSAILNLSLKNEFSPYTTATDKYLPSKKFIVDSQEIYYHTNKTEIKLIEKK